MSISPGERPIDDSNEQSKSTIILENEILLMKLNAEFGAHIFLPEQRVDPEIENHFLRSVYDFEKNAALGREREIIFKIIGEPCYPDNEELNDGQVSNYLNQVLDLLYEHKIVLDTLAEYPDRELYRFITREFFQMEIDRPGDANCYMHFCYEDFYSNHDYDLRQATSNFINFLIDDLSFIPQNGLYPRVRTSSGLIIGYKEATTVIRASCAEFSSRSLKQLEFQDIVILEDVAFMSFEVAYSGLLSDGGRIEVKGEGQLEFVYADESWWISFLKFPGIVI